MKVRILASALTAAMAVPGIAAAAPTSGVVLDAHPARHSVEVIDHWLQVHAYRFRGSVAGLKPGAVVTFSPGRGVARDLRVHGRDHSPVRFLARVLASGSRGVTVRLSDGRRMTFPVATAASVARGYKRGTTVVATISSNGARGKPSVSLMSLGSGSGAPPASTGGGAGGSGSSGSSGSSGTGPTQTVVGTISSVSGGGLAVSTSDGRQLQFIVDDPSITDGYLVGDGVTITYNQLSDGSLDASDVQYYDQNVSGIVTAVTPTSVTIINSATNAPMTLVDLTVSDQMFQGVSVGDEVDIAYYQSAVGLSVDNLNDNGPPGP